MDHRRDHQCAGGRGHPDEVTIPARRHALEVESNEAPRAAHHVEETDEPAELDQMECLRRGRGSHCTHAPSIGENRGCDPKSYDVRKRIKFFSECAVRPHRTRDSSIERIEQPRNSDRKRRIVEVPRLPIERDQNCIVATQKIRDRENARKNVNAATETAIAKGRPGLFCVPHRIYAVEFHFCRKLSPPSLWENKTLVRSKRLRSAGTGQKSDRTSYCCLLHVL